MKPRIIHLVNNLRTGGVTKVVQDLCADFIDDYEIHIIALTDEHEVLSLSNWPTAVQIHVFNFTEDKDYSLFGYLIILFDKSHWRIKYESMISLILELQPRIIHCHLQPRELLILLSHGTIPKERLLFTDHSTRIRKKEYKWLNIILLSWVYRRIYRNFHVVAVSQSVHDYHKHFKIISKKKLYATITNKVNTSIFTPTERKEQTVIKVIYVARLHSKKGHDTLIRAWTVLNSKQKAELILVGDGPLELELRDMAKATPSIHPIVFTGNVNNVLPLLQAAHVGVFPSLNEGLPLSLLEKMSCGLPVIVSSIPEFKTIIQEGVNGLFFEVENTAQLSERLKILIEDPELRKALGANAREFVLSNFSHGENRKAYQNIYDSILSLT